MNHLAMMAICGLLFFYNVEAAFKDFVIEPQSNERVNQNDMAFGCEAEEDEETEQLINLQDVMQEGFPDAQKLLSILMQHAQRLGVSLEQLAEMHSVEDDDPFNSEIGCSAAESNYVNQPTSWYDVFFN